jgi:hypothetical protein
LDWEFAYRIFIEKYPLGGLRRDGRIALACVFGKLNCEDWM